MNVSIILVNYNTKQMTIDAVNSVIEKTKDISYEIIVVDNASVDGSADAFETEFLQKVKVIRSQENLGFGKGNNLGINIAQGKYVFLLNTDTLQKNNAIKILYDFMECTPNAGICGGNLFDANNLPAHSFKKKLPQKKESAFLNAIKTLFGKLQKKNSDFNHTKKSLQVGYITGADMMIRADLLQKSGLFDPDFFMYSEECELTSRISKLGYKAYSVPDAEIVHLEGASFGSNAIKKTPSDKAVRMSIYSEYVFFDKVYGRESVKKRYKYRKRYNNYLLLLTMGLYLKRCKRLKKFYNEEFERWKNANAE